MSEEINADLEEIRARMAGPTEQIIIATPENRPNPGDFVTYPRDVVRT
jgi:hypothetical protein